MSEIRPISCALHDHLEIACLFGYELDVVQENDGSAHAGRAVTTRTAVGGVEYLVLTAATGKVEIPMHKIDTVKVRTQEARFSELTFDAP